MAQFLISAFADETSDDLGHQIEALRRNGLRYLEPRSIHGPILNRTEEELREIHAQLCDAGIGISSFGSPIGKWKITDDFAPQLEQFRRALRVCRILGTHRMRMFSYFVPQDRLAEDRPEVMRRLRVLLDEAAAADVLLCHENESKIYGQNPAEVADLLSELPGLRGIFDAANYVMNDQDALAGIDATLPRLEYLHVKDAICADKAIVPAGMGDGQYGEVLRRVDAATDRTVFLTVEPHLHIFQMFGQIDSHKTLRTGIDFTNSDDAFDCAVDSLKKVLTKIGFHEEENGVWKK